MRSTEESPNTRKVMALLSEHPEGIKRKHLLKLSGVSSSSLHTILDQGTASGRIARIAEGVYIAPSESNKHLGSWAPGTRSDRRTRFTDEENAAHFRAWIAERRKRLRRKELENARTL